MSDDRWVPWPAPTNKELAELLGITEEEVGTYRLDTRREGDVWRISLAMEILSEKRARHSGERIPASLILEVPLQPESAN